MLSSTFVITNLATHIPQSKSPLAHLSRIEVALVTCIFTGLRNREGRTICSNWMSFGKVAVLDITCRIWQYVRYHFQGILVLYSHLEWDGLPRSHMRRTCHQGHGRFRWRSGSPCSRCQTSPASIGLRSFQTSTPWNWIISANLGKRWVCIHTIELVHCSLPPFATKHLQADALARRDVWKDSWKQAPWHDGESKSCFFSPLFSWLMAFADCSFNASSAS